MRELHGSIMALVLFAGCGQAKPMPMTTVPSPGPSSPALLVDASAPEAASPLPERDSGTEAGAQVTDCPQGMLLVDVSFCPNIERRCIDEEYSPQNKITICHKYATTQKCLVEEQRRRFCID